jgi:predicted TIM-barrel fold metal-dependent hydrolase
MTTRRQFFGAAAVTAAAVIPALANSAAAGASSDSRVASTNPVSPATPPTLTTPPAPTHPPSPAATTAPRVLVDWHSHFVSKAEIRFLSSRQEPPRLVTDPGGSTFLDSPATASSAAGRLEYSPSDIDARIQHLDQHGIARQLLSHTVAAGLDTMVPLEQLRPLFRSFNDELAEVIRRHPTRFLAVAALPSADPQWAADELKRAQHELGFIGGSLPLNAFATLEGAQTLTPLFNTAQQLKSHFFIHRGPANGTIPGQPPIVIPTDTAYARWGLISNTHLTAGAITLGLTDFLDPYPDVSVEIIMLGGFFPYLIDSWVQAAKANGVADPLRKLRRLYIDPGPYSRNGEWVRLAAEKLGADRILFGTDYGVGGGTRGDVGPALTTLDAALSPQQRTLIYVDNSAALLRSKGRTVQRPV